MSPTCTDSLGISSSRGSFLFQLQIQLFSQAAKWLTGPPRACSVMGTHLTSCTAEADEHS